MLRRTSAPCSRSSEAPFSISVQLPRPTGQWYPNSDLLLRWRAMLQERFGPSSVSSETRLRVEGRLPLKRGDSRKTPGLSRTNWRQQPSSKAGCSSSAEVRQDVVGIWHEALGQRHYHSVGYNSSQTASPLCARGYQKTYPNRWGAWKRSPPSFRLAKHLIPCRFLNSLPSALPKNMP
jgi:hypothetical protein